MGASNSSMVPSHIQEEARTRTLNILARLDELLGNPYTTPHELELLKLYIRHHIFVHLETNSLPVGNDYIEPAERLAALAWPLTDSFFLEQKDKCLGWRYDRNVQLEPLEVKEKVKTEVHGLMMQMLLLSATRVEWKPWMGWILRWRLKNQCGVADDSEAVERRSSNPGWWREHREDARMRAYSLPEPLSGGEDILQMGYVEFQQHLEAMHREIENAVARQARDQPRTAPHVHFADDNSKDHHPEGIIDHREPGGKGQEVDEEGFPKYHYDKDRGKWIPIAEAVDRAENQHVEAATRDDRRFAEAAVRRIAADQAEVETKRGRPPSIVIGDSDDEEDFEDDEDENGKEQPKSFECPFALCGRTFKDVIEVYEHCQEHDDQ